jgi:hypothetical protein
MAQVKGRAEFENTRARARLAIPESYDPATDPGDPFARPAAPITQVSQRPWQGPPQPGSTGDAYNAPGADLRSTLASLLGSAYGGDDPRAAEAFGNQAGAVGDYLPVAGSISSGQQAQSNFKQGNYGSAGLDLLGALPDIGPPAKAMALGLAAVRGGEKAGLKAAENVGRDELAAVVRPTQEKSGVFDYGASYEPRDLGVQRFVPKKVPERTVDLLSRPDVYDKMVAGVERGVPVKDWYETGPLRKSFEDQLGTEAGLGKFDQFIDSVAATSPRSDVGTNVRNASFYYGKAQPTPGNPIPSIADLGEKNPAPYGHLAQNLHRMNAEKSVFPGGAGLDFKANAKPISFAANLKGDPSVATIDTHAFRAPAMAGADPRFLERSFMNEKGVEPRNIMEEHAAGKVGMDEALGRGAFWQSKPLPTEYAAFEDHYKKIGQELGLTPAETQAAGWVGHGQTTGLESAPKSFMDFVEERILKTARERGMDPKDVWKMAVSGKMPLLSAGAAAGGAAALQGQQEGDLP